MYVNIHVQLYLIAFPCIFGCVLKYLWEAVFIHVSVSNLLHQIYGFLLFCFEVNQIDCQLCRLRRLLPSSTQAILPTSTHGCTAAGGGNTSPTTKLYEFHHLLPTVRILLHCWMHGMTLKVLKNSHRARQSDGKWSENVVTKLLQYFQKSNW